MTSSLLRFELTLSRSFLESDEIVIAIHRDRSGDLTEGVGELDIVAEPRPQAGPDLFS